MPPRSRGAAASVCGTGIGSDINGGLAGAAAAASPSCREARGPFQRGAASRGSFSRCRQGSTVLCGGSISSSSIAGKARVKEQPLSNGSRADVDAQMTASSDGDVGQGQARVRQTRSSPAGVRRGSQPHQRASVATLRLAKTADTSSFGVTRAASARQPFSLPIDRVVPRGLTSASQQCLHSSPEQSCSRLPISPPAAPVAPLRPPPTLALPGFALGDTRQRASTCTLEAHVLHLDLSDVDLTPRSSAQRKTGSEYRSLSPSPCPSEESLMLRCEAHLQGGGSAAERSPSPAPSSVAKVQASGALGSCSGSCTRRCLEGPHLRHNAVHVNSSGDVQPLSQGRNLLMVPNALERSVEVVGTISICKPLYERFSLVKICNKVVEPADELEKPKKEAGENTESAVMPSATEDGVAIIAQDGDDSPSQCTAVGSARLFPGPLRRRASLRGGGGRRSSGGCGGREQPAQASRNSVAGLLPGAILQKATQAARRSGR